MTAAEFVRRRQERWGRLEGLLLAPPGHRLSALDVTLVGSLYRQVTTDLAMARRDFPYDPVTPYLNQLAARTHTYVYRNRVVDAQRLLGFIAHGFPRLVRDTIPWIVVALLCSILPAIPAFVATARDDRAAEVLLPSGAQGIIPLVREGKLWLDVSPEERSSTASFIMSNNIRVALIAFAGGATFGLLTLYVLLQNGLMLGATAGLVQAHGLSLGLWSFVAPHGVIELTVIFISGGAGLRLAWSILHPGLRPRAEAIAAEGRAAAQLLFGCVPLLIVAGTLEGFVSPAGIPSAAKFGISGLTAVLLYGYLVLGNRSVSRLRDPNRAH